MDGSVPGGEFKGQKRRTVRTPSGGSGARERSPFNTIDVEGLTEQARNARPFPHVCIEGFLEHQFALECAAAFPTFEEAEKVGRRFSTVNEQRKVQITEASVFPEPIARLHEALASPAWLGTVSTVMGIPNLVADSSLRGGGIHITGPGGHLDVHVDFNRIPEEQLWRRLNILLYLNPEWEESWGGNVEFWDPDVKVCHQTYAPRFNRCVIFETNDVSFHGVTAVACPPDRVRQSYAAYYYTREAPGHRPSEARSTVFRARPNEKLKGWLLMPLESAGRSVRRVLRSVKKKLRG